MGNYMNKGCLEINHNLYGIWLIQHIYEILSGRIYIKFCDETVKSYFRNMIPEYARILSQGDNQEKERREEKLMTYLQAEIYVQP